MEGARWRGIKPPASPRPASSVSVLSLFFLFAAILGGLGWTQLD